MEIYAMTPKYAFLLVVCFLFMQGTCQKDDMNENTPISSTCSLTSYKDQDATNFFRRTTGVVAADGGFSIPLSGGKVLWLLGDSYIDNYDSRTNTVPCLFQVHSAGLLQSSKTNFFQNEATTLLGSDITDRSYFKIQNTSSDANRQVWVTHGYQYNNSIYVYLFELIVNPNSAESLTLTGNQYMATINRNTMQVTNYAKLPFMDNIMFNSIVNEGEYMYAYGAKRNGIGSDNYVARFKASNPICNWEFWTGNNWDVNYNAKKNIAIGLSATTSFTKIKGKYVMTTSEFAYGCNGGSKVFSRVSNTPYGPFENEKLIWTVDDRKQGNLAWHYMPSIHPEFVNQCNEVLLTYSINGYEPCIKNCVNGHFDADAYRLKAVRVPLKTIHSTF